MESCFTPWNDGQQSAPNKSLWPAHATPPMMRMKRENSAAANDAVGDHFMLEKLITQQLAACSTTWLDNPASSSDIVKEPATSENKLCGSTGPEFERTTAALRRIVKEGATNCKGVSCETVRVGAAARVRARRGEATDQHSISERTRRTKITDRMRALHKLIPDASKTNKASMLDEVIQYVSMLQARLKMECARKLDARGHTATMCSPGAPSVKEGWRMNYNRIYANRMIERVLDPLEDRLAEAERQVLARLSHPCDLSLASTYLASAGLSLLPISHLPSQPTATSSNPNPSRP